MTRPAATPPPTGPSSGARAVASTLRYGFEHRSTGPNARHHGELCTVVEHPDGRVLHILTTAGASSLIRVHVRALDMWPDGVPRYLDSATKVAQLLERLDPVATTD
jgi:hypothetical protein